MYYSFERVFACEFSIILILYVYNRKLFTIMSVTERKSTYAVGVYIPNGNIMWFDLYFELADACVINFVCIRYQHCSRRRVIHSGANTVINANANTSYRNCRVWDRQKSQSFFSIYSFQLQLAGTSGIMFSSNISSPIFNRDLNRFRINKVMRYFRTKCIYIHIQQVSTWH